LVEAGFFLFERAADGGFAGFELGKNAAHFSDERFDERAEERFVSGETQLSSISNRTPQDPAQHVVAAVVAGHDAVGDGETQGPQVVGDDAEGDRGFHFLGEGRAVGAQLRIDIDVGFAAEFLEFAEDGSEDVGGVVGGLF
jgi:hypothetical protein